MATVSVPNTLANGTTASAVEVQGDFDALVAFINASTVHVDGSKSMTGSLDVGANRVTNVSAPTAASDAANKAYVDAATNSAFFTRSTDIALSASDTSDVTFETESGDTDTWWPGSGFTFTCLTSGQYAVSLHLTVSSGTASASLISISGSTVSLVMGTAVGSVTGGEVFYFKTGDSFKVRVSKITTLPSATVDEVILGITKLGAG